VFLLITNWEGFPRSVLEAMRAGLPVVSSDVGGVSESVEPGRTGFLVPRGDAGELQKRLRQLLTDAELRMRLGQEGRRQYENRFQFDRTTARTMSIYRDVLSQRGRSESGSPQIFPSSRKREGVAAKVSDGESAGD
jgi:glycosyltransferase involved in cell wall biosynthesis